MADFEFLQEPIEEELEVPENEAEEAEVEVDPVSYPFNGQFEQKEQMRRAQQETLRKFKGTQGYTNSSGIIREVNSTRNGSQPSY